MHKGLVGSTVGVTSSIALGAAMVPIRSHLSIATTALVLVIPVVAGVTAGNLTAGLVSVAAGFFVYDFAFIRPYYTLAVGSGQNWMALGVYVVVMLLVAQVVARLDAARSEAQRRANETRRLYEMSEVLVRDRSVEDLLATIVHSVRTVFGVPGVAVLLPVGGRLEVAVSAGEAVSAEQLRQLDQRVPVGVGTTESVPDRLQTIALSASDRPIGLLALSGLARSPVERALLRTFANHAALAVERAQLREQAMRSQLLEEVDHLRSDLLGAVSHDLRTPLASLKVASTTLLDRNISLSQTDADELHTLIDVQADRLTRMVTGLLDMTRFQAGVLAVRRELWSVLDVVGETVAALGSSLGDRQVDVALPDGLPLVEVDHLLISQVLANLIENADRHAPAGTSITITAVTREQTVAVSVIDRGAGLPVEEREEVFDRFVRFDTGGRSGLGLAIAKSFVEAHEGRIWVEDGPGGGASFVFTLPVGQICGTGR